MFIQLLLFVFVLTKYQNLFQIVCKAFLLLGGIELTLNITFRAEKSIETIEIWPQNKNYPLEMAPHNMTVNEGWPP